MLLDGVRRRDPHLVGWIYQQYFPPVRRYLLRNNGEEDDAREVFQIAMLILLEKSKQPDFAPTGSLRAYFLGVCRIVWLKKLKENAQLPITSAADEVVTDEGELERAETYHLRQRLYHRHFARLGEQCRAVLTGYLAGESMRTLAERLGYSEAYVRLKKFKCKEQLRRAIRADADYPDATD